MMSNRERQRTNIPIDLQALPNQLDFSIWILDHCSKTLLDALYLLRYRTENALFESIELVEASPRPNLTEPEEDTAHGLEIKCFIATENKNKTTKLDAQRFHRLSFTCIKKNETAEKGRRDTPHQYRRDQMAHHPTDCSVLVS